MTNESENTLDDAIDFKNIFAILQRWAWLIILSMVIGAAAAFIFSARQTPVYEVSTNILVNRNSSQQSIGDVTQSSMNLPQLVETYVRMLSLDEFLAIASQRLGYEINSDNITVTALQNTQIIELRVQDIDPKRAAHIADTMVVVLAERNETLQASRYADAEASLDVQIKEIEVKIADVQAQLDAAKNSALIEQVTQAKANIDATVTAMNITQVEVDRMEKELSWESAHFRLSLFKSILVQQQASLDQQISARNNQEAKLSDPLVQANPDKVAAVQAHMADMDTQIEATRGQIEDTQKEITFLTPLDTEEGFKKTLVEKQNLLTTQQSLLASYQDVYTGLLSTEEVKRTTNEIDNAEKNLGLYQEIYVNLLNNLEDVKKQKMQNIPTIEQVSPAVAGEFPVKPRTLLNTLLGGLAGLILAGSVVVLRETTDDTIKDRAEVEKILGVKVLGYIIDIADESDGDGIYVARIPRSPVAEAFRSLRSNLEFFGREKPLKTILVTSSGPGEGKTTIAANLAASLAHSGKKVVLLDADLRRPRIHRYIGLPNQTGLSDWMEAGQTGDLSTYIQKLETPSDLSVLTSGGLPSDPTDLLSSDKMRQLIGILAESNDYVVIDSPPMLVADPQVLSGMVDGILLVMVPGQTRKDVTYAVKEQMERTSARLLGVVFNRLKRGSRSGYSGYSYYYYPYYYSSDYYSSAHGGKGEKHSGDKHRKKRSKTPLPEKSQKV